MIRQDLCWFACVAAVRRGLRAEGEHSGKGRSVQSYGLAMALLWRSHTRRLPVLPIKRRNP